MVVKGTPGIHRLYLFQTEITVENFKCKVNAISSDFDQQLISTFMNIFPLMDGWNFVKKTLLGGS